jgi:cobalamin biosynthesis protein CobT
MMRPLSVLPLALVLAASFPAASVAEDTADECRKMAVEEEVAPEDLEDYIAECLAVIQSESPEEAAQAMDRPDQIAPDAGKVPDAGKAPDAGSAPAKKP